MNRRLLGWAGVVCIGGSTGCGAAPDAPAPASVHPPSDIGETRQAVGPQTASKVAGTSFAQVGRLTTSGLNGGSCTATVIAPNVVIAAAHCVCANTLSQITFNLDDFTKSPPGQAGGRTIRFSSVDFPPNYCTSGSGACQLGTTRSTLCGGSNASFAAVDLAVMTTTTPILPSEMLNRSPMRIITNWETGVNFPRTNGAVFVGYGGTVFATGNNSGTKRFVNVPPGNFLLLNGVLVTSVNNAGVFTGLGDSGGPYLTNLGGGILDQIGVSSGWAQSTPASCPGGIIGDIGSGLGLCGGPTVQTVKHSPTFDDAVWVTTPTSGRPTGSPPPGRWQGRNGEFIRQFIHDDDYDSVVDEIDNCPQTSNVDQKDSDGDGVGDACDNCGTNAPSGILPRDLVNPRPSCLVDSDCIAIGAGTCASGTCTGQADSDHDGFGDSCDTCPGTQGALNLESTDRDFVAAGCDNCPDDTIPNSDQKDTDGDGEGDVCDACPFGGRGPLGGNANVDAESDQNALHLGDGCDPVPTFGMTQVWTNFDQGGADATSFNVIRGYASAVNQTVPGPLHITENTTFRYCSCIAADGTVLSKDDCQRQLCPVDRNAQEQAPWLHITGQYRTSSIADGPVPIDYFIGVDADLPCEGKGTDNTCELGKFDAQGLFWRFRDDVNAGTVPFQGTVANPTLDGIVWARTDYSTPVSDRDVGYVGRLRSVYAAVHAPRESFIPPIYGGPPLTCTGNCFTGSIDYLHDPDPPSDVTFDWTSVLDDRPFLVTAASDRLTLVRGADLPVLDVTSLIGDSVGSLIRRSDLVWTHAVEPSLAKFLPITNLAIPREFVPGQGIYASFRFTGGALGGGESTEPFQFLSSPQANAFGKVVVPNYQRDARLVFSASQASAYLFGGRTQNGAYSGEMWRADLARNSWEPIQTFVRSEGHVLAATMRPSTQELVIFEELPATGLATSGNGTLPELFRVDLPQPVTLRMIVIDLAGKRGVVAGQWPRLGLFDHFDLALTRDNKFVMTASTSSLSAWTSVRFDIDPATKAPTAFGLTGGLSTLQGDVVSAQSGLWVPIKAIGSTNVRFSQLHTGDFLPLGLRHACWEDLW